MKKFISFLGMLLISITMCANNTDTLNVELDTISDMCSDYYILSMDNDTVAITTYEYEHGINDFYDYISNEGMYRLNNNISSIINDDNITIGRLIDKYNDIKDEVQKYNPECYKCDNKFEMFFNIGKIELHINELLNDIIEYKNKL